MTAIQFEKWGYFHCAKQYGERASLELCGDKFQATIVGDAGWQKLGVCSDNDRQHVWRVEKSWYSPTAWVGGLLLFGCGIPGVLAFVFASDTQIKGGLIAVAGVGLAINVAGVTFGIRRMRVTTVLRLEKSQPMQQRGDGAQAVDDAERRGSWGWVADGEPTQCADDQPLPADVSRRYGTLTSPKAPASGSKVPPVL